MEEKRLLIKKEKKRLYTKTHVIVILSVMFYGCAAEISGNAEPQYIFAYLKSVENTTLMKSSFNFTHACGSNNTGDSDENIQGLSSDWTWYISLAQAGVAVPILMFAGPVADKIGRKPLILWTVSVVCISYILKTYIVYKKLSLYYYVIASAIRGLSGSFYAFHLANIAILADTTAQGNERSFIIILYEALLGIGTIVSSISAGYLIEFVGYTYPYFISSVCTFLLLLLIFLLLEDPYTPSKESRNTRCKEVPVQFCTLWKPSKHSKTSIKYLLLTFVIYCFVYTPLVAFSTLRTIYVLGQPFCWSSEHIGWYSGVVDLIMFVTGSGMVKLIHRCCHFISNEMIVIFGQLSAIACYVIVGISNTDIMVYIATLAGFLRILPISLIKAHLSHLVDSSKQGVLFSNVYVIEAICSLGGTTVFNNIYHQTLSLYRGLVFFVMAAFTLVSLFLQLIVLFKKKSTSTHELYIQESKPHTKESQETSA